MRQERAKLSRHNDVAKAMDYMLKRIDAFRRFLDRLFSQISINWAGQPLRSLDVMLALIRGTTTTTGLKVRAYLDQGIYRRGRKVTDKQMEELMLSRDDVCPRWNYTLAPRSTPSSS